MSRYLMVFALIILLVPGTVSANPERTFVLPGDAEIEMVWIPSGTFMMGTRQEEIDRLNAEETDFPGWNSNEGPQHEVSITRGFYLGKYEITQAQWESVMGTRPWSGRSYFRENANHPAVYISWNDMRDFVVELNEAEGSEVYRLPTEAEWEYACRAGTTTPWSFGDDESQHGDYAWYYDNAWNAGERGEKYAHAVGTKLPNPWGFGSRPDSCKNIL